MNTDIPNASQRWRLVRMVISYQCFALSVLFLAFWAHSYKLRGVCTFGTPDVGFCSFVNVNGQIPFVFVANNGNSNYPFQWQFEPHFEFNNADSSEQSILSLSGLLSFNFGRMNGYWLGRIPHGILVIVTGVIAILLKPKPRLKFSLIGLLLLTTSVAVAFGVVEILASAG